MRVSALAVAAAVLVLLFHAVVAVAGAGGIQVVAHRDAQRFQRLAAWRSASFSVLPARATSSVLSAIPPSTAASVTWFTGGGRMMFGRPIGATQIQQTRLAVMLTEITRAQLLAWWLGVLKDAGTVHPEQVSPAKRNNVNMACEIAREARRLLGGNSILVEYQSMRHMANLESVYTFEDTHDVHALILGQDITGIPAY
jgi:hypothetical protein